MSCSFWGLTYSYKGCNCSELILRNSKETDGIELFSDFGEKIGEVRTIEELYELWEKIRSGELAW